MDTNLGQFGELLKVCWQHVRRKIGSIASFLGLLSCPRLNNGCAWPLHIQQVIYHYFKRDQPQLQGGLKCRTAPTRTPALHHTWYGGSHLWHLLAPGSARGCMLSIVELGAKAVAAVRIQMKRAGQTFNNTTLVLVHGLVSGVAQQGQSNRRSTHLTLSQSRRRWARRHTVELKSTHPSRTWVCQSALPQRGTRCFLRGKHTVPGFVMGFLREHPSQNSLQRTFHGSINLYLQPGSVSVSACSALWTSTATTPAMRGTRHQLMGEAQT